MIKIKNLTSYLKKDYNIAVGERTAETIKRDLCGISRQKIKISGRSYETGKKKTVNIPLAKLLKIE